MPAVVGSEVEVIRSEVQRASLEEARLYLLGAAHDGTFNQLHRTLRITQADVRWLEILNSVLLKLGKRSWTYREGSRSVWTIETTYRPESARPTSDAERHAFVRGYFDSEGGIPRNPDDRFYVQFVQKDFEDLDEVRTMMSELDISCGSIHNPSSKVDANYWRFYVSASSWERFIHEVSSWHPRKRRLLDARAGSVTR